MAVGLIILIILQLSLTAGEVGAQEPSGGFRVLPTKLPMLEPTNDSSVGNHKRDGWLILDPRTRRGYQVFRLNFSRDTVLRSFDLDTLQPLRRAVLKNFAVMQTGEPGSPGDVVHAVDEERGRIFLVGQVGGDQQWPQVAVVDEEKLDDGRPESEFARRLSVPESQKVQILLGGPVVGNYSTTPTGGAARGMAFSRRSGAPKLLLLFGSISLPALNPPVHNHWLAQWDPDRTDADIGDWIVRLAACESNQITALQGWQYQLEILRAESSVSVACSAGGVSIVRFPLLSADGKLDPGGAPSEDAYEVFPLPRQLSNVLAAPESERLLVQVQLNGTTWWAFDGQAGAWVGGAGETLWTGFYPSAGVDPSSGILYSMIPNHRRLTTPPQTVRGGLKFTESNLTPVPQFTDAIGELAYPGQFRIWIDPEVPGRARRIFMRRGNSDISSMWTMTGESMPTPLEDFYLVIEDTTPKAIEPALGELDRNTNNVAEEAGITGVKFDAGGSGFGFRHLLVGGITPAISRELDGTLNSACYKTDREVAIGRVERAGLSDLSASASSFSLFADEGTKADLESPSSRCWPNTLGIVLPTSTAQAIDDIAGQQLKWDANGDGKDDYAAECSGDEGRVDAPTPEKTGASFSSWAVCQRSDNLVKAFSWGRFTASGDPVSVMSASSSVTVTKATEGGTITTVDSIARGVEVIGVGSIGLIRTVAVAQSAGKPTTAETSFERSICNVDMPGLKFTSCLTSDQQKQFVDALNRLLRRVNGKARLRNPDPQLWEGTPGGYLAAIQRNRKEALDDKIVTRDASETVPGLEIIFYRGDSPTQGSGRQVFQFAAVQASSAYGIFCLFGEVPNSGEEEPSCVRPTSELTVQLTDDFEQNPTPLLGGVFQVHLDEDGDGILGVDDAVLELGDEEAVCTTADDGVGDCVFELPPGRYIVHQVKAPDGFAPSPDCAVSLPAFTSMTCDFVNSPNIGLIYVGLTDDSPEPSPLAGGVFELYVDDGDKKLGKGDMKLASCTTDVFGDCVYKLPDINGKALPIFCAGSPIESEELKELIQIECIFDPEKGGNILAVELGTFIVHQSVAPPDYSVAEDQVLPLANPWDIGVASFVNGLAPVEGTPRIEGTPSRQSTVVIEEGSAPRAPVKQSAPRQEPQSPKIITRIVMAPSEAIGFLLRHPKQAAMFASIWLLLVAPLWLVWRRRSISTLKGAA